MLPKMPDGITLLKQEDNYSVIYTRRIRSLSNLMHLGSKMKSILHKDSPI